jgi:hypothetical protein
MPPGIPKWGLDLAAVVFIVGDGLAPDSGFGEVLAALKHGDVFHEAAGGSRVPALLTGRGVKRLAGVNLDDLAVAQPKRAMPWVTRRYWPF